MFLNKNKNLLIIYKTKCLNFINKKKVSLLILMFAFFIRIALYNIYNIDVFNISHTIIPSIIYFIIIIPLLIGIIEPIFLSEDPYYKIKSNFFTKKGLILLVVKGLVLLLIFFTFKYIFPVNYLLQYVNILKDACLASFILMYEDLFLIQNLSTYSCKPINSILNISNNSFMNDNQSPANQSSDQNLATESQTQITENQTPRTENQVVSNSDEPGPHNNYGYPPGMNPRWTKHGYFVPWERYRFATQVHTRIDILAKERIRLNSPDETVTPHLLGINEHGGGIEPRLYAHLKDFHDRIWMREGRPRSYFWKHFEITEGFMQRYRTWSAHDHEN